MALISEYANLVIQAQSVTDGETDRRRQRWYPHMASKAKGLKRYDMTFVNNEYPGKLFGGNSIVREFV